MQERKLLNMLHQRNKQNYFDCVFEEVGVIKSDVNKRKFCTKKRIKMLSMLISTAYCRTNVNKIPNKQKKSDNTQMKINNKKLKWS